MNILQMSFAGAVMILTIIVVRALAINKLPKKAFLILWGVVLIRLLIPFSFTSVISAYSVVGQNPALMERVKDTPAANILPVIQSRPMTTVPGGVSNLQEVSGMGTIPVWAILWIIGMAVCGIFFIVTYIRCHREFKASLPVEDTFAIDWINTHHMRRTVTVRQSGRISSPLTYGIVHPVILMPGTTDWHNTKQLQYVLAHEYVHIRRFDAVTKILLTGALCIHWFNPLVWAMYILANRDMELSCDESVVRSFGENTKSAYARTLISMEETRNTLTPLCNSFSKNAIEERITAIMKMKKTSLLAILTAAGLIVGVIAVFASSAADKQDRIKAFSDTEFATEEEYREIAALQFREYEDMTIAEYQQRVREATDEQEYMEQKQLIAHWNSVLELYLPFGLTFEPDEGEEDGIKMYFQGREVKGITNEETGEWISEHAGNSTYSTDAVELYAVYKDGKLTGLRLATEEEQKRLEDGRNEIRPANEKEERTFGPGTKEDYESLLKLKTDNYKKLTVAEFNRALLDWANEDYERMERINEDFTWNDYRIQLSEEELAFVRETVWASRIENAMMVRSYQTGKAEEPATLRTLDMWKQTTAEEGEGVAWCRFDYQFAYEIADREKLTVEQRDNSVMGMKNAIDHLWEETDLETLLDMDEQAMLKKFQEFAAKYSSEQLTISIDGGMVLFEHQDERRSNREE